jgi:hypothetical protein
MILSGGGRRNIGRMNRMSRMGKMGRAGGGLLSAGLSGYNEWSENIEAGMGTDE